MRKLLGLLLGNIFPLALIGLVVVLAAANYTPGTWLSGWDTLHPEFDFPLNLKRVLTGVWRAEQGLGAVAGHSHMAELPRILFLWLASLVLPVSTLRYFFFFLALALGPLGVYFFLERVVFGGKEESRRKIASFLGSLFYLLNLATVQFFFVPFEMFASQYAALGWLFLFATRFLKEKKRVNLLAFALVSFLASPMAYAATLWYTFFLALTLYLFTYSIYKEAKVDVSKIKTAAVLVLITLVVNAYWLLPNLYFFTYHAADVPQAKINQLFSDEAFLHNREYANFWDAAILRGFLFNWTHYRGQDRFENLLLVWQEHLKNPAVLAIGFGAALLVLVGVWVGLHQRQKAIIGLLPVFGFSLFFLISHSHPWAVLTDLLLETFPVAKEALRMPYTKFALILLFTYSVYFALAQEAILEKLGQLGRKGRLLGLLLVTLVASSLIFYFWPGFTGHLVSPRMRVAIPERYFEMFAWFKGQPQDARIATLPAPTHWGWEYYNWGFQGAGFIWFGLKQPVLVRDFDRWNPANEQFYREFSHAIYSKDQTLFEQVLEKYQVGYLVLDESVVLPGWEKDPGILYLEEIKKTLAESEKIKLAVSFGQTLNVYQVSLEQTPASFVYSPQNFVRVAPRAGNLPFDLAYEKRGTYISRKSDRKEALPVASYDYPYRSLLDRHDLLTPGVLKVSGATVSLTTDWQGDNLAGPLPDFGQEENYALADLTVERVDAALKINLTPSLPFLGQEEAPANTQTFTANLAEPNMGLILSLNGTQNMPLETLAAGQEVNLGKVLLQTRAVNRLSLFPAQPQVAVGLPTGQLPLIPEVCGPAAQDQAVGVEPQPALFGFRLYSKEANACVKVPLYRLAQGVESQGNLLVQFQFDYEVEGKAKPQFCLFDTRAGRCLKAQRQIVGKFGQLAKQYTDMTTIRAADVDHFLAIFYLDTLGSEAAETVLFQNVLASFHQPLYQTDFSLVPERAGEISLVQNGEKLELKFDIAAINQALVSPSDLARNPETCSDRLPKFFDRRVVEEEGESYVQYSAVKGSSCDHYDFPNLVHDQGYLLLIEAKNASGLPLRLCLTNYVSRRCDLYTTLSESKVFATEAFLIPPLEDEGVGYDVNLNNVSVGTELAVNEVKSVRLIPFPYRFLQSIEFENPTEARPTSALAIHQVNQVFPFLYRVSLDGGDQGAGLLTLSQSYEDNWLMLGGRAEHVLVNDWANGWLFSGDKPQGVILVFVPQLLEYLGFLLPLLILPWLAWKGLRPFFLT